MDLVDDEVPRVLDALEQRLGIVSLSPSAA